MKSLALCIVLALVFGVVAGAAFQVTGYIGRKVTTSEASSDQVITDSDEVEKALGSSQAETSGSGDSVSTVYDVSAVAEAAMPSLVSITNMGEQEIQSFFGTYTQPSESSGTGIIIGKNDDELLIATNNHVLEGSEQLNVCFIDNEVASALVKGTDPSNDLAVIAVSLSDIPEETLDKITIAQLGDSDSLKIGEPVIAIGNALGYGQSVTTGVISALDREVNHREHDKQPDPDRCSHQSRQQWRCTAEPAGTGHRHQLCEAGIQPGRRYGICHPHFHSRAHH